MSLILLFVGFSAVKAKNVVTLSVDDIFAQPGIGVPGVSSVQFQSTIFWITTDPKSLTVLTYDIIIVYLSNGPAFWSILLFENGVEIDS